MIGDLKKSRLYHGVSSMGGMIVCKTNQQAKNLYELFCKREESENKPLRAALILSDEGSMTERKDLIKEFKNVTAGSGYNVTYPDRWKTEVNRLPFFRLVFEIIAYII